MEWPRKSSEKRRLLNRDLNAAKEGALERLCTGPEARVGLACGESARSPVWLEQSSEGEFCALGARLCEISF